MLKLHFMAGACSLVPHVALQLSGLPYEVQAESQETIKSPAYLAMNPLGAVPLLVDTDDGWTLTQNVAILDYLHDLVPQAGILGQGADLRQMARAQQWLLFANSELHKVFGAIFAAGLFIDGEDEQAQVATKAREKAMWMFGIVDRALAGQDYLSGLLSAADVYLYTIMRWTRPLEIDLSQHARLAPYYARVERDPGVLAALKEEGLL